MIVKPSQAASLWCPFSIMPIIRAGSDAAVGINRADPKSWPVVERETRCISNKCMAWRWAVEDTAQGSERQGYCGLASRSFHP